MVDTDEEEICVATRLLLLSSNVIFSARKQKIKNDSVKGKDNYYCTVFRVLKFLWFHSLHSNIHSQNLDTIFPQDGELDPNTTDNTQRSSTMCGF